MVHKLAYERGARAGPSLFGLFTLRAGSTIRATGPQLGIVLGGRPGLPISRRLL